MPTHLSPSGETKGFYLFYISVLWVVWITNIFVAKTKTEPTGPNYSPEGSFAAMLDDYPGDPDRYNSEYNKITLRCSIVAILPVLIWFLCKYKDISDYLHRHRNTHLDNEVLPTTRTMATQTNLSMFHQEIDVIPLHDNDRNNIDNRLLEFTHS